MNEDSRFNFWPPFVDFMLFLLLALLLSFSIAFSLVISKYVDLGKAPQCEERLLPYISKNGNVIKVDTIKQGTSYRIFLTIQDSNSLDTISIKIINQLHLQRILVSAGLLFPKNEYTIKPKGYELLKVIGKSLRDNISCIQRIQIEGHADPDPTTKFRSNLELAGLRAFEVFYYMKDSIGIDPVKYMMSAASFGEYKPIGREESDTSFTMEKLLFLNSTEEAKSRNRRVEFLIFYKK